MGYDAFESEDLAGGVADWIGRHRAEGKPAIVGLSGAQGIGKSTLSRRLTEMWREAGVRATAVSLDDFYLTRSEQAALAESFPSNRYLQSRGYPGTHDLPLALETLSRLGAGESGFKIPHYDKSAFNGKGDRAPESQWSLISAPQDIVIFEGWMLGFTLVDQIAGQDPSLKIINERLEAYRRLWDLWSLFVFLDPLDHTDVLKWRVEAEEKMKASGKTGMTREEIEAYARLFMPAYETYLPGLRERAPKNKKALHVRIAQGRNPSMN